MALYFLDTSALVKLCVREPGTEAMLQLANPQTDNGLAVLSITPIEFCSVVRRRERAGDMNSESASEIVERFTRHLETRFLRQPLTEPMVDTALTLVDRYVLRAYDAVQLAGCLVLKLTANATDAVFVCADATLLEAARAEGTAVLDPA